jgi:hypothetical protein
VEFLAGHKVPKRKRGKYFSCIVALFAAPLFSTFEKTYAAELSTESLIELSDVPGDAALPPIGHEDLMELTPANCITIDIDREIELREIFEKGDTTPGAPLFRLKHEDLEKLNFAKNTAERIYHAICHRSFYDWCLCTYQSFCHLICYHPVIAPPRNAMYHEVCQKVLRNFDALQTLFNRHTTNIAPDIQKLIFLNVQILLVHLTRAFHYLWLFFPQYFGPESIHCADTLDNLRQNLFNQYPNLVECKEDLNSIARIPPLNNIDSLIENLSVGLRQKLFGVKSGFSLQVQQLPDTIQDFFQKESRDYYTDEL